MEQSIVYAVIIIGGLFLTLLFARWILRIDYIVKLKEAEIGLLSKIAEKNDIDKGYIKTLLSAIK